MKCHSMCQAEVFFFFLIFGEMNSGECDEAKGRHSFHSSCYTIKVADQPPRDQEQKPSRQVRGPTDQYSHGLVVQLKALFTKKKKSPRGQALGPCAGSLGAGSMSPYSVLPPQQLLN